jgi:hypothetical protein
VAVQALGLPDISTTYITGTYTTFISRLASPRRLKIGKVTVKKKALRLCDRYVRFGCNRRLRDGNSLVARSPYYPCHHHRFCDCCSKISYVLKDSSMLKFRSTFASNMIRATSKIEWYEGYSLY